MCRQQHQQLHVLFRHMHCCPEPHCFSCAARVWMQVNLDFETEQDMVDKFRIGLALQPIAVALFANSPFVEGKPTGYLSTRGVRGWGQWAGGGSLAAGRHSCVCLNCYCSSHRAAIVVLHQQQVKFSSSTNWCAAAPQHKQMCFAAATPKAEAMPVPDWWEGVVAPHKQLLVHATTTPWNFSCGLCSLLPHAAGHRCRLQPPSSLAA